MLLHVAIYHKMTEKLSPELMARAISHSGTAYTPHAIARDAKAQAFKLALLNGCPPQSSSAELKKCLQKVPADTLIGQTPSLFVSLL